MAKIELEREVANAAKAAAGGNEKAQVDKDTDLAAHGKSAQAGRKTVSASDTEPGHASSSIHPKAFRRVDNEALAIGTGNGAQPLQPAQGPKLDHHQRVAAHDTVLHMLVNRCASSSCKETAKLVIPANGRTLCFLQRQQPGETPQVAARAGAEARTVNVAEAASHIDVKARTGVEAPVQRKARGERARVLESLPSVANHLNERARVLESLQADRVSSPDDMVRNTGRRGTLCLEAFSE